MSVPQAEGEAAHTLDANVARASRKGPPSFPVVGMTGRRRLVALPLLTTLLFGATRRSAGAGGPPPASTIVYLNSTAGATLLRNATHARPFLQLAQHFVTQVRDVSLPQELHDLCLTHPVQNTQSWCSLATSVTVLNALLAEALPLPVANTYAPYPYLTQEQAFNQPCVRAVTTHTGVNLSAVFLTSNGATLDEWAQYTSCFAPAVRTHASNSSLQAFRAAVTAAFSADPVRYIAINYQRVAVGQTGGGHMSPVAAYDATTDSALVLDVARYRYPPSWVSMATLFASMATVDTDAQASRGWIELGGTLGIPKTLPRGSPAAATGINGTLSRACMASLADPNNVVGIQACLSNAAIGGEPPRPPRHPAASCPPAAPASSSGGSGILLVWAVVASMAVFMLAVTLRQSKQELRRLHLGGPQPQPRQPAAAYVASAGAVSIEMNGGAAEPGRDDDTAPLLTR
jgi:hypothetical protein